jgi:hypothetical protein
MSALPLKMTFFAVTVAVAALPEPVDVLLVAGAIVAAPVAVQFTG